MWIHLLFPSYYNRPCYTDFLSINDRFWSSLQYFFGSRTMAFVTWRKSHFRKISNFRQRWNIHSTTTAVKEWDLRVKGIIYKYIVTSGFMSYSYNASLSQDKYRYVGPIPYNNFIITLYQLCDNQQSNFIYLLYEYSLFILHVVQSYQLVYIRGGPRKFLELGFKPFLNILKI